MRLREILELLKNGKITVDDAERLIKLFTISRIKDMVRLDISREFRIGVPEVIYAEFKDNEVLKLSIEKALENTGRVIISRIRNDQIRIINDFKKRGYIVRFNKIGRIAVIKRPDYTVYKTGGKVGIITAGTADIPLAEEVKTIVEELGCDTITIYDVGISALHRTIDAVRKLIEYDVDVIIAIAGMEGALPSVVKSLVDIPVIGLPASKGYGKGGGGEAALLSMLQSCSPGLLVVNIDNTVGAALAAVSIANRVAKFKRK